MPAPTLGYATGVGGWDRRTYIQFGGLPIPVGNNNGATMAYLDLNDGVNWFAQHLTLPDAHHLETAQKLWLAKSVYISEDYDPIAVRIPFEYRESGGATIFSARAKLMTAGEQVLTFDGVTGYTARCRSLGNIRPLDNAQSLDGLAWSGELDFVVKEPFFKTIAQSSSLANAIAGSAAGAATNLTLNYAGSFFAEPQFILNVPVGNGAAISQLKIANTSSGETITIALSIPASQAHTVTIDSSVFQAWYDSAAVDISGSFPMLWPIGNNAVTVTLTTTSGNTTGVTLDVKWYERWL